MKSKSQDWKFFWESHPEVIQRVHNFLNDFGVSVDRRCLYYEAFVHRSAASECVKSEIPWNERLEFLGDSVLGLAISTSLWNRYENLTEGEFSSQRSSLVSRRALSSLARFLDLGSCLALGMGERRQQAEKQDSLLANLFEAVIGAMYLDVGYDKTAHWVEQVYLKWQQSEAVKNEAPARDSKTCLQEWAQRAYGQTPAYELVSQKGPSHAPEFEMAVMLGEHKVAQAVSTTKKQASQLAAEEALLSLEKGEGLI